MDSSSSTPEPTYATTVLTPINLLLLTLLAVLTYLRLRPKSAPSLPAPAPPTVFRTFTPPTLLPNNGTASHPVYIGIRGRVYDVTAGASFYGPGGPYANFAGRDATRGLACGSFDEEMLTKDLHAPLDDLAGLGPEEMDALKGWEEHFMNKYLVVGRLVPVGSEEAKDAE